MTFDFFSYYDIMKFFSEFQNISFLYLKSLMFFVICFTEALTLVSKSENLATFNIYTRYQCVYNCRTCW